LTAEPRFVIPRQLDTISSAIAYSLILYQQLFNQWKNLSDLWILDTVWKVSRPLLFISLTQNGSFESLSWKQTHF